MEKSPLANETTAKNPTDLRPGEEVTRVIDGVEAHDQAQQLHRYLGELSTHALSAMSASEVNQLQGGWTAEDAAQVESDLTEYDAFIRGADVGADVTESDSVLESGFGGQNAGGIF